ncbi:MAG: SPW repeat protein [Acetobacteraceae bacterium]
MATMTERYRERNRSNRWQDWVVLVSAVWLFISPWILQFGGAINTADLGAEGAPIAAVGRAAWNAWILGVIVFLIALSAVGRMNFWQEYWNAGLGAWIFIAPWVLGFAWLALPAARWDHWITGAVIFAFSVHNLYTARQHHHEAVGPAA